eukprot:gene33978-43923_t
MLETCCSLTVMFTLYIMFVADSGQPEGNETQNAFLVMFAGQITLVVAFLVLCYTQGIFKLIKEIVVEKCGLAKDTMMAYEGAARDMSTSLREMSTNFSERMPSFITRDMSLRLRQKFPSFVEDLRRDDVKNDAKELEMQVSPEICRKNTRGGILNIISASVHSDTEAEQ